MARVTSTTAASCYADDNSAVGPNLQQVINLAATTGVNDCGTTLSISEISDQLRDTIVSILTGTASADTFGVPSVATAAGVDFFGNTFVAGDNLIILPGNNVVRISDVFATVPDTNASLALTNGNDGDGSIVITVTPGDGSAPYDITLPEPSLAETDGVHFSGQPTIDAAGIVTFPTVNDLTELVGAPVQLNLSSLISGGLTGTGDVTVTGSVATGFNVNYNRAVYSAGTNVNIGGTGTVADPFVISTTDVDTFAQPVVATGAGVDFFGKAYAAGDALVTFPNGLVVHIPPIVTDTAAQLVMNNTGAPIVTSNGAQVMSGATYILLPNGQTWSYVDTNTNTDTFSVLTTNTTGAVFTTTNGVGVPNGGQYLTLADGTTWGDLDTNSDLSGSVTLNGTGGNLVTTNNITVAPGAPYVEFPDGTTWAFVDTDEDNSGDVVANTTGANITTTNGVQVVPGAFYVQYPNGDTWAQDAPASGLVQQADAAFLAANGSLDTLGRLVVVGDWVQFNENGSFHRIDTNSDQFTDVVQNTTGAALTTTNGVTVAPGDQYLILPNGDTWSSETFGGLMAAATAGTDSLGNPITVGQQILTAGDGSTVNLSAIGATNIATATLAGTDSLGNAIAPGDVVISNPDGTNANLSALNVEDDLTALTFAFDATNMTVSGNEPGAAGVLATVPLATLSTAVAGATNLEDLSDIPAPPADGNDYELEVNNGVYAWVRQPQQYAQNAAPTGQIIGDRWYHTGIDVFFEWTNTGAGSLAWLQISA